VIERSKRSFERLHSIGGFERSQRGTTKVERFLLVGGNVEEPGEIGNTRSRRKIDDLFEELRQSLVVPPLVAEELEQQEITHEEKRL
jgi:hypothetical protein